MRFGRMAIVGAGLFAALTAAAPLQVPVLAALDRLEAGAWELRAREPGGSVFNLCLGDPRQMLQIRHPGKACTRYVVQDKASEVTVHYVCPGAGQGRTTLRVETARLVQIHTQGIAQGAPFAFALEGRRKGRCE